MRRIAAALLAAGVLLLALALFLSLRAGAVAMPSYLADWLFWSSLPFGALPVVMLLDLTGPDAGPVLQPALRRLLVLTPFAALLMIPVLVRPGELFGWVTGHGFTTPFGHGWMTHGWFIARSIFYGVCWTILALIFFWPASPSAVDRRRGIAAAGLFFYLLTATLASVDWAMVVEPNWFSPTFGILLISAQMAIAVSFSILLTPREWLSAAPEPPAALLLLALGAFVFTQFIQFLVIWSADKPADITWYLHRSNLGSRIVVWIVFIFGAVIPVLMVLSSRLRRRPAMLPAAAVLVTCTQALGMLWLITPSLRHDFTLTGMDVLELAGLGGVMLGICLWAGPPSQITKQAAQHA